MTFPEAIDLVIYINLNIRTDRRQETEAELARLNVPPSKILRWPATRNTKNGAYGCSMSHVAVLEHISTLPDTVQNILILEDDFNFVSDTELITQSLSRFLAYPADSWDIGLLSYDILQREVFNDFLSICLRTYNASGYLLNRTSLPKVLANFKEGLKGLLHTGEGKYYLDIYWWHIMKDRKCFYFNKPLGYQRKSYSNIVSAVVERPSRVK